MSSSAHGREGTKRPPSSGAALSGRERAELQRQGAKAAARGEPPDANPIRGSHDSADRDSRVRRLRHEAWRSGYEAQMSASTRPARGCEQDGDPV